MDEAVEFLRRKEGDQNKKSRLIELLTQDLMLLDTMESSKERRNLCHAVNNLLGQLENEDNVVRLSEKGIETREAYLPCDHDRTRGDSMRALGKQFS